MIVYVYNIFEKLQKKLFTMHASREWNLGFLGILQPFKAGQVHSGFGQMEENSWSHGDVWHAFIQGKSIHPTSHVSHRMSHRRGVPNPLYNKCTQSQQGAEILYDKAWFCACGPILKATGILLIRQWGILTDAISPTLGNVKFLFLIVYHSPLFGVLLYIYNFMIKLNWKK